MMEDYQREWKRKSEQDFSSRGDEWVKLEIYWAKIEYKPVGADEEGGMRGGVFQALIDMR